ncbi:tail fiber domain-containing protein [Microbacterium sp. T2.11-28]|uniref:tail fiber domain-containing protein n=1 Tax=Microbacterium sp. T2.11-28 TaxID=3041169 RepID=UPI002477BE6C|nr:tail fiber domain-containing protein [Microbacterium sp. T2.11-28]CAI9386092.1 hypothetical protein MICABA_00172 [Microbacterium sp. T2.11-28]
MATGDAAAAAGMDLVPQTGLVKDGATEINKTRDYIASNTADIAAATGNGSGAGTNKLARFGASGNLAGADPTAGAHFTTKQWVEALGDAAATPNAFMKRNASGQVAVATPTLGGHAATKAYHDAGVFPNDVWADGEIACDGGYFTNGPLRAVAGVRFDGVYGNAIGGSYRNLYVSSTGELGWVSSSRRYKKNIKDWTPDRQALLAMRLVEFQYKVAVDTQRTGAIEHGLIAEELDELGLDWLVDYAADGTPEGVRYDRLSLALLSVVQDHETRIHRLEEGA